MQLSILPALLTATLLSGCLSVPGAFSPVQGPLSKQSPMPTYAASMSGILYGTISVVLDNGEVCKGPWGSVSQTALNARAMGTTASTPFDMSDDWDSVYGAGYFTAHVLGSKVYARATLIGKMGTVLHVEFNNESNTAGHTKGVAADNNGNVFKVSVYN